MILVYMWRLRLSNRTDDYTEASYSATVLLTRSKNMYKIEDFTFPHVITTCHRGGLGGGTEDGSIYVLYVV